MYQRIRLCPPNKACILERTGVISEYSMFISWMCLQAWSAHIAMCLGAVERKAVRWALLGYNLTMFKKEKKREKTRFYILPQNSLYPRQLEGFSTHPLCPMGISSATPTLVSRRGFKTENKEKHPTATIRNPTQIVGCVSYYLKHLETSNLGTLKKI